MAVFAGFVVAANVFVFVRKRDPSRQFTSGFLINSRFVASQGPCLRRVAADRADFLHEVENRHFPRNLSDLFRGGCGRNPGEERMIQRSIWQPRTLTGIADIQQLAWILVAPRELAA